MGRVSGALKAMGFHLGQDQKRQIIALDREFEQMQSTITELQAENQRLLAKVNPLQRQVEQLTEQRERARERSASLEQTEIDILILASQHPQGITSPQIAQRLNLPQARVEHFLNELKQKELITFILVMGGHARYVLDHKGNAYLVKNNLV